MAVRGLRSWFRFSGVNILLKITTFSFLKDFLTKRAYLYFTKSEILRILFFKNMQSKSDIRGLKSVILRAFS